MSIQLQVERLSRDESADVWSETLGAWRRREAGETTIRRARQAFQRAFERRHGASDARLHR